MRLSNFGAVRRLLLVSAVLTLFAFPVTAQMVERSQTWASLIATHPCNAGLNGRHTILTDAQSSSSIGGGGGSTRVFVECDGVDTWSIVSIGGSGSGVSGLTTADGGTALSDNAIVRGDGTTGVQGSTVTVADSTGNLQWEGATADAFEGNFTFADPTADWTWAWGAAGQVAAPVGSSAAPTYSFAGDPNTGIYGDGSDSIRFATNGTQRLTIDNGTITVSLATAGNANLLYGFLRAVSASTAGSGAPSTPSFQTNTFVYTNEGSTAENYHTLPAAASGYNYTFFVQDADGIRITAAAGDTIRPIAGTAASATGGFIRCATQGAFITLVAINNTEWVSIGSAGVWTIDI